MLWRLSSLRFTCVLHPASRFSTRILHSVAEPPSTYPPRVTRTAIYGGGSMGVLHGGLMQRRVEYQAQRQRSGGDTNKEEPTSERVTIISAQEEMVELLNRHGCTFELLTPFVRANQSWIFGRETPVDDPRLASPPSGSVVTPTHFTLPAAIRIAGRSSLIGADRPTPTHILVMVKGVRALDRVADELYHITKMVHQKRGAPMPTICIVMNGLGHIERILERISSHIDGDPDLALSSCVVTRATLLASIRSCLYLATTTSGAKLTKTYAPLGDGDHAGEHALQGIHLKHGGMGVTMVIQNEHEANTQCTQTQPVTPVNAHDDVSMEASGSASLVSLFRSIGLETHLAPFSTANSILYTKLIVNCAINPLTALHSLNNGALRRSEFTPIIVGVARECCALMKQLAIRVADYTDERRSDQAEQDDIWPDNIQQFVPIGRASDVDTSELRRALWHIYSTITRTASNYSSMFADLHADPDPNAIVKTPTRRTTRITTEIEAINGHVLAEAKKAGMDIDTFKYNKQLYESIKQEERSSRLIHLVP